MLRELASFFSSTIAERRASSRKKHSVPIKVCFAPEFSTVKMHGRCDDSFMSGETTDVSATGIGFIVPAIRIKEKYLVGQERILNVELDLSGRKVRMQVRGVRYERIGIHLSAERFVVGAEIVNVNEEDQAAYDYLLRYGKKAGKATQSVIEIGVE
jgi:hypothetical protein